LAPIPHIHIDELALHTTELQKDITKNRENRGYIIEKAIGLYESTLKVSEQDMKLPMSIEDKEKLLLKQLNDRYMRYFIDSEMEEH
jgi:hypothetical protein